MRKTESRRGKRSNKRRKAKDDKMKKKLTILFIALLLAITFTTISYIVLKSNKTVDKNGERNGDIVENNNISDNSQSTSDIQDLVNSEDNTDVLSDLKSDKENGRLVYKQGNGCYYEYIFKGNKIKEIYFYTECGNKQVAEYMLNSYKKDEMKAVYSNAEIYKEVAIKAKMSEKLIQTYSSYTIGEFMKKMQGEGNELM